MTKIQFNLSLILKIVFTAPNKDNCYLQSKKIYPYSQDKPTSVKPQLLVSTRVVIACDRHLCSIT